MVGRGGRRGGGGKGFGVVEEKEEDEKAESEVAEGVGGRVEWTGRNLRTDKKEEE